MSTWLLESVQDVPRSLSLKFHHNQVLRYSWYGQISRGQKLPGQMLPLQLESVLDVHRNLPLKFHQNRVSNSWDIANIEFLWWGGVGWGGAQSLYCQTKPCVEVRLGFWQYFSPSFPYLLSPYWYPPYIPLCCCLMLIILWKGACHAFLGTRLRINR